MQKFIRACDGHQQHRLLRPRVPQPHRLGMQKTFGTGAATNSSRTSSTRTHHGHRRQPHRGHPVTGAKIKQQIMKGTTAHRDRPAPHRAGAVREAPPAAPPRHQRGPAQHVRPLHPRRGLVKTEFIASAPKAGRTSKRASRGHRRAGARSPAWTANLVRAAAIEYASRGRHELPRPRRHRALARAPSRRDAHRRHRDDDRQHRSSAAWA
jgi:hypothetical protein